MQKLPVAGSYAALESAVKQSAVCVQNGDGDLVKVFGPQIGWKSVFLIECVSMPQLAIARYAGTDAFKRTGWTVAHHPVFHHLPKLIYDQAV